MIAKTRWGAEEPLGPAWVRVSKFLTSSAAIAVPALGSGGSTFSTCLNGLSDLPVVSANFARLASGTPALVRKFLAN